MILFFYSIFVVTWDVICFVLGAYFSAILGLWHIICPPAEKPLDGCVVVIAGAGRGIGRELALQMAGLGARVASWDIDRDATLDVATKGRHSKGKIYPYIVDVTDRSQVFSAAEQVKSEMGPIAMVINCCNMPSPRCLVATPPCDIQSTISRSIFSHFWITQAILPQMLVKKRGHIVVLSSVAGLTGIDDQAPLTVSQFAVQGYAEALRQELHTTYKDSKINITLVHVYPFLVSRDLINDIRLRIPSYLGTLDPYDAATQIITGVRQGVPEMSVPGYLIYLGSFLRLMPYKLIILIRDFFDTGVDFG